MFWKFLPRNSEGPFLIQMAYFGKFGSIEMSVASWSSPRLSALELTLSSTVGWGVFSLLQSSSFGEYSSLSSSSSFSYKFWKIKIDKNYIFEIIKINFSTHPTICFEITYIATLSKRIRKASSDTLKKASISKYFDINLTKSQPFFKFT